MQESPAILISGSWCASRTNSGALPPGRLCHMPVSFGDHHWQLTDAAGGRWFITVAELAGGPLPAALEPG